MIFSHENISELDGEEKVNLEIINEKSYQIKPSWIHVQHWDHHWSTLASGSETTPAIPRASPSELWPIQHTLHWTEPC